MTGATMLLLDSWVSACGAVGAAIVLLHLPKLTATPELARRFRALLLTIIILMAVRVGHWAGLGWFFTSLTYALAALLPLLALLVAEGMMRLHAPKLLKRYCAWGALVFVALAILPTGWMEFAHLLGLLLFQLFGFVCIAFLVFARDRTLLSDTENRSLNRVALSFVLIIPFVATDYFAPTQPEILLRLGGLAVLGLCLLTINLNRAKLSQRRILVSTAALIVFVWLLTFLIAQLTQANGGATAQIAVAILSTSMAFATWQAARALVTEDHYLVILREIAQPPEGATAADAARDLIRNAVDVSQVHMLREDDLSDFDVSALRSLFDAASVRTVSKDHEDEQLAWFFTKFEATHALSLSTQPLTLVAFHNPNMMAADTDGYGLGALQRVAAQMVSQDRSC